MRLSDKVCQVMQQSRKRIIDTMLERGLTKVALVMTQEEYAKDKGFNDAEDAEDDYNDYMTYEAPYVVYWDKYGRGSDYAVLSVELELRTKLGDGSERPTFRLNCYNDESGDDWFYDYDVLDTSMVAVYDCMLEVLELSEEPEYVWVFSAEQTYSGETLDVVIHVFPTEESACKHLQDFLLDDGGEESIREMVRRKKWEVEEDDAFLYRAHSDDGYSFDHVELTVTKCVIE